MGGACRVSKSFDQRNSMAGPRASSANELVSAAEKNDLKRTITFAASSPRARVQAQERGSIAGRHSTAGRLSFSSKSFSFSARRPKGELKEAEEMTRSLTMAARKARGPQSGWAKARKGLGFAGKLNLAEITVNAIEVEVKNLCERWGVPYVAGPALEQPEVLLERHRTLRKQCLDAKQRHCHVLVKSGRARVARTAGLGALDGQIVRTLHVEKRGRDVWGVLVRDGKGEQTAVEAHLLKAIEVAVADTTDANAPGLLPRLMPGASSSELLAADPLSAGRATSPDYCRDSSGRASRSGLFAMGASSGRVAPLSSKGSAPLLQSSKSKLWFSSKAKNYPPAPNFDNCSGSSYWVSSADLRDKQAQEEAACNTTSGVLLHRQMLLWRRIRRSLPALPSMPLPVALVSVFETASPPDASLIERKRDGILAFFAQPTVSKIFTVVALLVSVCVILAGLLITWAVLGLFLGVDNGWTEFKKDCLDLAAQYNQTLGPQSIPTPPGAGYWFNLCIKIFTILFSYINFLPIPWRLSILHHVTCSKRDCSPGCDFYGRPTDAKWFNIPTKTRLHIAILLNLAWSFHFWALAMHIVYPTYVQGQTWPGAFWQNLPFVLSIIFAIWGGVMQGKAEDALRDQNPDLYPPKIGDHFHNAVVRWMRAKRNQGGRGPATRTSRFVRSCCACCRPAKDGERFIDYFRAEMAEYKDKTAALGRSLATNALTGCDGVAATKRQAV